MKKLNERYAKIILGAAEKMWETNKAKMIKKGIDQNSYMLGFLHGYEACFDTYGLGEEGDFRDSSGEVEQ